MRLIFKFRSNTFKNPYWSIILRFMFAILQEILLQKSMVNPHNESIPHESNVSLTALIAFQLS